MIKPIQFLAASRARLAISAVFGVGLVGGAAYPVAQYIREQSTSAGGDVLVLTSWMFLVIAAGYIAALFVADLLFPHGWREINILGKRVDISNEEDTIYVGATTRNQTFPFAALWVCALLLLMTVSRFTTGDFFDWYAKYGYAASTLRGDNIERKTSIMEEMTRALDSRLITYSDLMVEQLDSDQAAVRHKALWCLGEVGRRMVRSIELMAHGAKGADWVFGLHQRLEKELVPKLLKLLEDGDDPGAEPALVFALGAMQSKAALGIFAGKLKVKGVTAETRVAIIKALAASRDQAMGIPMLRKLIVDESDEVAMHGLWAVGEVYGFGTGDASEDSVDSQILLGIKNALPTMKFERQCVTLDLLQRLRSADMAPTLFKLFATVKPTDRACPRREVTRPFQAPELVSKGEEFRQKIVKTLATIADGNEAVLKWLKGGRNDSGVASGIRSDMEHILRVVKEREFQRN